MTYSGFSIVQSPRQIEQLKLDLADARQRLQEAEAALTEEQASINAFRMHCRLKLGDLVERLLEVRVQKQRLLTELELGQQAEEMELPFAEAHRLGEEGEKRRLDDPKEVGTAMPALSVRDKAAEKRLYRELARRFHPDLAAGSMERAYTTAIMAAINRAYKAGDIAALRQMAGELDPAVVAEFSGGETEEIRKLQHQILACKRRQNKVAHQAQTLHEENTARLWRKAQQLIQEGLNWWEEVRTELEKEIRYATQEIEQLKHPKG